LNITVKAKNLILNGKNIKYLHLNYYFSSSTELVIEWPILREKMLLVSEPEQLKVVMHGVKENYGFLSENLHAEFKSLWKNPL